MTTVVVEARGGRLYQCSSKIKEKSLSLVVTLNPGMMQVPGAIAKYQST